MAIQQLAKQVKRLLGSTQLITSVRSVVKELVENSIDAGATIIDVKMDKYGLDRIEVRDNGSGISESDTHYVCRSYCTSKINNIEDIEHVSTYGFRGEALNSMCTISDVTIITRTEKDNVARVYKYNQNGDIVDSQISHQMKGTTIIVSNLFKNVPVRRHYFNTNRASEELRKTEKALKMLAVINPKIKISFSHNKNMIWQKSVAYSLDESFVQSFPHISINNLEHINRDFNNINLEMYIPKRDCHLAVICQPSISDAIMVFINRRPVKNVKIEKLVLEEMVNFFASKIPHKKYPFCLVSLTICPEQLDVNVEPDKSVVFIKDHQEKLLKHISEAISAHFYPQLTLASVFANNIKLPAEDDVDNVKTSIKRLKTDNCCAITNVISKETTDVSSENNFDLSLDDRQFAFNDSEINNQIVDNSHSTNKVLNEMQTNILIPKVTKRPKNVRPVENKKSQRSLYGRMSELFPELVERALKETNRKPTEVVTEKPDLTTENNEINEKNDLNLTAVKSVTENKLEKEPIDCNNVVTMKQTSMSQWSKGHVDLNGNRLEGGTIVMRSIKPVENNVTGLTEKAPKNVENAGKSLESDDNDGQIDNSSQLRLGFTQFVDEIKRDIVKNNPGISFVSMANKIMSGRHRTSDDQNKKGNVHLLKKESSEKVRMMQRTKKDFSISTEEVETKIKRYMFLRRRGKVEDKNKFHLITDANSNLKWLCRKGSELGIIKVLSLREIILLHKNLSSMELPLIYLDIPVTILLEDVGQEMWNFLLSLKYQKTYLNTFEIVDSRLIKNGFKIELHIVNSDEIKEVRIREIYEMYLGREMDQLYRTLCLMKKNDDIMYCRSSLVMNCILSETDKMCKSSPPIMDKAEVEDMIQYWANNIRYYKGDLSQIRKDFFYKLYSLV